MDDLIRQLVKFDGEGREVIKEANRQAEQIRNNISETMRRLEMDYETSANSHLQKTQDEANAQLKKSTNEFDQRYNDILKELEENYRSNKDSWIEHIVNGCFEI